MAYDPGAIDLTLSAAVGDSPELIAELRLAFVDGACAAAQAMRSAPDDAAWRAAALRLQGLTASFGAVRLMGLAASAAQGPRDVALLARVERAVARL